MIHRISRRTRAFCAGLGAGVPVPFTTTVTTAIAAERPQAARTPDRQTLAPRLQTGVNTIQAVTRATHTATRATHKVLVPTTARPFTPTSGPQEAFPAVSAT